MNSTETRFESVPDSVAPVTLSRLTWCSGRTALLVMGAVASFQLAFLYPALSWLVLGYFGCLFALRQLATVRQAFYVGVVIGLGVFVPQMSFLWTIFNVAAVPLWLILALFHGLFLLLLNRVEFRFGTNWAIVLAPVLWCGIEYFRSEVWWLRFSWFSAGSVFDQGPFPLLTTFGIYGAGFLGFLIVTVGFRWWQSRPTRIELLVLVVLLVLVLGLLYPAYASSNSTRSRVEVAGIQLEVPGVPEVRVALDRLVKAHPEAELLMLSEYTFDGPVPESVKTWCRKHRKWLVAGGKQPITEVSPEAPAGDRYFNTAFVISPNGEVVFTQAKSRPIQFFKDGEPAREQRVWDSPWGKLGIAICYDASYRRVMDGLVRQGAQALLIPTMDLEQWGGHQHRLNARMARLRAAEYRLPIFRVASSGISQLITRSGRENTAPFPGPGEMIAGTLPLRNGGGSLPLDAWLAPACFVATGVIMLLLVVLPYRSR